MSAACALSSDQGSALTREPVVKLMFLPVGSRLRYLKFTPEMPVGVVFLSIITPRTFSGGAHRRPHVASGDKHQFNRAPDRPTRAGLPKPGVARRMTFVIPLWRTLGRLRSRRQPARTCCPALTSNLQLRLWGRHHHKAPRRSRVRSYAMPVRTSSSVGWQSTVFRSHPARCVSRPFRRGPTPPVIR